MFLLQLTVQILPGLIAVLQNKAVTPANIMKHALRNSNQQMSHGEGQPQFKLPGNQHQGLHLLRFYRAYKSQEYNCLLCLYSLLPPSPSKWLRSQLWDGGNTGPQDLNFKETGRRRRCQSHHPSWTTMLAGPKKYHGRYKTLLPKSWRTEFWGGENL